MSYIGNMNTDRLLAAAAPGLRQALDAFYPLGDADWQQLLPHLRPMQLPRDGYLQQPGAPATLLAYLHSGSMRSYYPMPDGRELTTYFVFEGGLVGAYASCIAGTPAPYGLQAMEPVEMLAFPYQAFASLAAQHPAWAQLARRLAEYLFMGLEGRLRQQLTLTPEQRYQHFLNNPPVCLTGSATEVQRRIPQKYLASFLGITPVSLSRIRGRITRH